MTILRKKCKGCDVYFLTDNSRKIFHNHLCNSNFYAKTTYKKIRNNLEYKKKKKSYHRLWREKNRKRWNELCYLAIKRLREKDIIHKIPKP